MPKLAGMEVHLKPDLQAQVERWVTETGRSADDLIEDAVAGYLGELARVHEMLDGRYDDMKKGRVKPIDGEAFFEGLRKREDELLKRRSPR